MKKLYCNGTVITMEAEGGASAVLVEDGVITGVGEAAELRLAAADAEEIDLAGATMLPAFIDAHGHFSSYANAQLQVSLAGCDCFDEIARRIGVFIRAHQVKPGAWVVANGYDHNVLAEKCHPTRALLDGAAPHNPLILQHQSGHCGVLNSRALDALGMTPETENSAGGVIGRGEEGLTGYLEEEAYIGCIRRVPMAEFEVLMEAYRQAQARYFSYGITTVQEGMMVAQMLPLYRALVERGLLAVDVVGYAELAAMPALKAAFPKAVGQYDRHFKLGGYKIILDGSPQVKTAWMKTPYAGTEEYGYGTMDDEAVYQAVKTAAAEGVQILAHCNGDAAAQQYLDAIERVAAENAAILALKPVMIHAQLLAREQLAQVARLRVIPSFFVAHVLHWGDTHIQNFGYDRAQWISPAQSALENGIPFTFHQDAPVIEPNMLETVQCAVTRRTKAGVLLGADQRISVLEALKAVTIYAARQYSEEDTKGSIKVGKQADLVVLSQNPLTVAPEQIGEIAVLETLRAGKTVFVRQGK